ncbi:hypothetical protein JRO89_XS01G0009000 [Xanthoceras sorbifolium]|uniref:Pentatricopeptide repeat-containing protein n=1 Tax=Xanthoceras sorbifolium TaxID=99658 RepID=A0ABQ8IHN8_9ROSI|nr:hypothetical protein JRO89_XS01G0009000 [Xanthoceras sorbifolium]
MFLLQSSLHNHHNLCLSSTLSYSSPLPCKNPIVTTTSLQSAVKSQELPIIRCSISQVHSYGTVDFERRPMIRWNTIYKKISFMENPEEGSASVLNQWENGNRKVMKWELCRVIKELRKYRRYKQALEHLNLINLEIEIGLKKIAIDNRTKSREKGLEGLKTEARAVEVCATMPKLIDFDYFTFVKLSHESQVSVSSYHAQFDENLVLSCFCLVSLVYEWMNNRGERFRLSASDAAIQLDLVAKVCGVISAEEFFLRLPDTLKDRRVYVALLNSYVRARIKGNAELLMDKMRDKGYATQALPFNVMMTLYMNLKEYDKIDSMVSEMIVKGVRLDIYSYNILLSSCGTRGSVEMMEQVYEQMKMDRAINPNWTTFSTMAAMYIKMGHFEKAEECLRRVESRITGRDRIPYHYLLSLYGGVGNKEEVYRVWNLYKSVFPSTPNLGYHAVISSLIRIGDIEGVENIYEEWLSVKQSYDPRITNLLMSRYVQEGNFDKAETVFNQMLEEGAKPNSTTWEILVEGHIGEERIPEALSCFKEAFAAEGSTSWRPNPANVSAFFKLCEEESDMASKEGLVGLLRQPGYHKDKAYLSLVGVIDEVVADNELSVEENNADNDDDKNMEDDSEMLLGQL